MKRREEQFNQDIDAMLHENRLPETPDAEYAEMLDVVHQLNNADFSAESRIRDSLREKLLNRNPKDNQAMLATNSIDRPIFRLPSFTAIAAGLAVLMVGVFLVMALNSPSNPEPSQNSGFGAPGNQQDSPQQQRPTETPIRPTVPPPGPGSPIIVDRGCEAYYFTYGSQAVIDGAAATFEMYLRPSDESPVIATIETGADAWVLSTEWCTEDQEAFLPVQLLEDNTIGWVKAEGDGYAVAPTTFRNPSVSQLAATPTAIPGSMMGNATHSFTATPIGGDLSSSFDATPTMVPGVGLDCVPDLPVQFSVGMRGEVDGTTYPTLNLRLRTLPSLFESDVIDVYAVGTTFTVIGGPECEDGIVFFEVRLDDGNEGWFGETFQGAYTIVPLPTASMDIMPTVVPCILDIETRLESGDRAIITDAFSGLNLRLREQPSMLTGSVIATYPSGTEVTVVSDAVCGENVAFYFVRLDDGEQGWFVETFQGEYVLAPIASE